MDVRREVEIAAPVERVWELITRPEHLRVWYAFDGARVDLRPGGVIEHFWKEHGRFLGVIERVRPPTSLVYRYSVVPDVEPGPGRQTRVEFELLSLPGERTLVRVTESGFDALEVSEDERRAHRDATDQGWSGGLAGLAELAGRVPS